MFLVLLFSCRSLFSYLDGHFHQHQVWTGEFDKDTGWVQVIKLRETHTEREGMHGSDIHAREQTGVVGKMKSGRCALP